MMDPPPFPNLYAAVEPPVAPAIVPSSTFNERLASYFEENGEGPSRWASHLPTPEEMAGAGFMLSPTGSQHDNATCGLCKLACFKWEAKDDHFEEHSKNNPYCSYVLSENFTRFRAKFRTKRRANARKSPAVSVTDDGITPKIVRRRKKSTLTQIQTVADLEPVAVLVTPNRPMRIQISSDGVSMDLTVNGNDIMATPTKKRRYN